MKKLFEYLITDYHNDWDNSMGDPVPLENIVSFNLIENGNSVVKNQMILMMTGFKS